MLRIAFVALSGLFLASSAYAQSAMYMTAALGYTLAPDYEFKDSTGTKSTLDYLDNGFSGALTGGWQVDQGDMAYGGEVELVRLGNSVKDHKFTGSTVTVDLNYSGLAFMAGGAMTNYFSDTLGFYAGASIGTARTYGKYDESDGDKGDDSAWAFAFGGKAGASYLVNDTTSVQLGYRLLSVGETELKNASGKATIEPRLHHTFETGVRFSF